MYVRVTFAFSRIRYRYRNHIPVVDTLKNLLFLFLLISLPSWCEVPKFFEVIPLGWDVTKRKFSFMCLLDSILDRSC